MRKAIVILVVLILAAGGVYVYKWQQPSWLTGLFSSSADAATTGRLKAALGLSKRLSGFDIGIETSDGTVTLTGNVSSEYAKSLAGEIARDTQGVREVRNLIEVNPAVQPSSESQRVDDLEIRAAILEAFTRSPELGGQEIDVKVEQRLVTLTGRVDTDVQRNGAEQTARAVDGVAGVTNELEFARAGAPAETGAPAASGADSGQDLAKRVKFELYDTGAFDVLTINVSAENGAVRLTGTVRNRAEQLLAGRVAQGTLGVRNVVNELTVAGTPPRR